MLLLVNGRLGAAERVISDLSVESLSLSRTEALCGYPFDITTPGAEEQDDRQLHDHRDNLSSVARATAIPFAKLPDADKHRDIVEYLRRKSAPYYDLQQIVRLLVLFREWREVEDVLIKSVISHFCTIHTHTNAQEANQLLESATTAPRTPTPRNRNPTPNALKSSSTPSPPSSNPSSPPSLTRQTLALKTQPTRGTSRKRTFPTLCSRTSPSCKRLAISCSANLPSRQWRLRCWLRTRRTSGCRKCSCIRVE